jgi:hypothetical protein
MTDPGPDLVASDLARLVNPGLRSPRAGLAVLPAMPVVQAELERGAASVADAIESVVNRGLAAMAAPPPGEGMPRPAADPVKALRMALALRPGSERVKSKTRRASAAQAMGLLSGDGWRAHHEKALLRDLADVICALDPRPAGRPSPGVVPDPGAVAGDAGISRFYDDFVDIGGDWEHLFAASSALDLAIMYGATWRHTYRKNLTALAARPGGRIRVVLPRPSPGAALADLYAHALGITMDEFHGKVTEAIEDFRTIGPHRHIEIYLTTALFRHALYLFSRQGVLALYALCGERIPTPALLASDGGLLSFMRQDFDRLVEHSERIV